MISKNIYSGDYLLDLYLDKSKDFLSTSRSCVSVIGNGNNINVKNSPGTQVIVSNGKKMKLNERIKTAPTTYMDDLISLYYNNMKHDDPLLTFNEQKNIVEPETKSSEEENIECNSIDETYTDKQIAKQNAKKKIKKKWFVGSIYSQKIKPRDGSKPLVWEYELIKYIYTINDYEMNSLIVKKLSGPEEKIYSLTPYDCKRLHIKFQPGLQIMSMNTKNLRLKKRK